MEPGFDYSEDICKDCGWYYPCTDYCSQDQFESELKEGERSPTCECLYFTETSEKHYNYALETLDEIHEMIVQADPKEHLGELYRLFYCLKSNLMNYYRTKNNNHALGINNVDADLKMILEQINTVTFPLDMYRDSKTELFNRKILPLLNNLETTFGEINRNVIGYN